MEYTLENCELFKLLSQKESSNKKEYIAILTLLNKPVGELLEYTKTNFPNFTDHTIRHSYRILHYIYHVINETMKKDLSATELFCLILSAFLHDIGMSNSKEKDTELIRKEHAQLSKDVIPQFLGALKCVNSMKRIANCVSYVCESHTKDLNEMYEEEGFKREDKINYELVRYGYLSILLRIGDLMDMEENRTSYIVRAIFPEYYQKNNSIIHHDRCSELEAFNYSDRTIDVMVKSYNIENYILWENWFKYLKTEIEHANTYYFQGYAKGASIPRFEYSLVLDNGNRFDIKEGRRIFLEKNTQYKKSLEDFMVVTEDYQKDYIKSLLFCPCKWGTYSYDEVPQNANTCEGIIALLLAHQYDVNTDVIEKGIEYLMGETTEGGLPSKSLQTETVVPTSMMLSIVSNYKSNEFLKKVNPIAKKLWESRSESGWGLYVRKMKKYANIGCTYWAIKALAEYIDIPENEYRTFIRSLFKYENTYSYGRTIDDVNPRMPYLYSTSMMYIIYMMLDEVNKQLIGKKYDKNRALQYILKEFDNPVFLVEQEGINGVNVGGNVFVHTINWNHMTIHYSLQAISIAIKKGEIEKESIPDVLERVKSVLAENSEHSDRRLYWSAPNMTLEREQRGKMIFPTMHIVMGLSCMRDAIAYLLERDVEGGIT